METGLSYPDIELLDKIAKILDVTVTELLLCAASLAVVFYTAVSREKALQNFDFTCILGAVISESVLFMAIGAFASFLVFAHGAG